MKNKNWSKSDRETLNDQKNLKDINKKLNDASNYRQMHGSDQYPNKGGKSKRLIIFIVIVIIIIAFAAFNPEFLKQVGDVLGRLKGN